MQLDGGENAQFTFGANMNYVLQVVRIGHTSHPPLSAGELNLSSVCPQMWVVAAPCRGYVIFGSPI